MWSQFPAVAGERARNAWRVDSLLGLDSPDDQDEPRADEPEVTDDPAAADLIVLNDGGLRFRPDPGSWPRALKLGDRRRETPRPWVLLKMGQPVARGPLWKQLLHDFADRLVVVMTLDDLRLSEVKISRELSWERTAGDLAAELVRHPSVNGLVHCAHVVVSLHTGGALLLSRSGPLEEQLDEVKHPDCVATFDPEAIEDSWADR